jgi:hypothetical protein
MARVFPHQLSITRILIGFACLALCLCSRAPIASAQHRAPMTGGVRVYTAPRPWVSMVRPMAPVGPGAWRYHPLPIGPFRYRPIFPIYGSPFYFGFYSWVWNSWGNGGCWLAAYYPCSGPAYGFAAPFYAPGPVPAPVYQYYGEARPDFPQLFLKDGTVYTVSDYWLVDDQLHFTTKEPGRRGSAEHVIGIDELDVETTIDENTSRGFRFVQRHEPLQQYVRDYPDQVPPDWPRPKE